MRGMPPDMRGPPDRGPDMRDAHMRGPGDMRSHGDMRGGPGDMRGHGDMRGGPGDMRGPPDRAPMDMRGPPDRGPGEIRSLMGDLRGPGPDQRDFRGPSDMRGPDGRGTLSHDNFHNCTKKRTQFLQFNKQYL